MQENSLPQTHSLPPQAYPQPQFPAALPNQTPPHLMAFPPGSLRPKVTFGGAVKRAHRYYAHFSGRASRSEFFYPYLIWGVLLPLLAALFAPLGLASGFIFIVSGGGALVNDPSPLDLAFLYLLPPLSLLLLVVLICYLPMLLSLGWRRLQDAGIPGWVWLPCFFFLGPIALALAFLPSSPDGLKYDKPRDYTRP